MPNWNRPGAMCGDIDGVTDMTAGTRRYNEVGLYQEA